MCKNLKYFQNSFITCGYMNGKNKGGKEELRTGRKLALVTVALILASLVAYVQSPAKSSEPELQEINVPALTRLEIRNPEIARKYDIVGYLEITMAPNAPKSLSVSKGGEASIMILLRFVSYVPEVTETQVKIDPKSGEGPMIEQYYVTEDAKGDIIGRGVVNINDLVTYNPSGIVTLKASQTLQVTLTTRIPTDFPIEVSSFPLSAVGITANVPIINDVKVTVYA